MVVAVALAAVVLSFIVYLFMLALRKNRYWAERGIKDSKPMPFIGNNLPLLLNQKQQGLIVDDIASAYPNETLIGYHDFMRPVLVVKDAGLIEQILIKDFAHFTDRGFPIDEEKHPMDISLFSMTGNRWRAFRYKFTPLFTSGKLKYMYSCIDACGENLKLLIDSKLGQEVELRELFGIFSMDVTGSAVFGIDAGVLKDPNSKFREMGFKVFSLDFFRFLKFVFITCFPKLGDKIGVSLNKPECVDYFCGILRETFKYRQENNIQRNDFVQMLLQLKEKGTIEIKTWDPNDDYLKMDPAVPTESYELNDNMIMSQAFSFLVTGFEAMGLSTMYAFLALSQHPEIQEKSREEVKEQVQKHGGLTYEALKGMVYLDNVIKESQRIHPIGNLLFRECTKTYTFPNGYTMQPGDRVIIPIVTVQKDPNYFPDPLTFRPERFQENIRPGAFLPFGDGPRMCIAMRFAQLQLKYGVAKCLLDYTFKLSPKVKLPLEMKPMSFFNFPKEKVMFIIEKNKNN